MNSMVNVCSPAEARRFIERYGVDESLRRGEDPFKGFVDVVARDVSSGDVAWEMHQPNVVTDYARRNFLDSGFGGVTTNYLIFSSPSTEAAVLGRYALADSGAATSSQISGAITPTGDTPTISRTWVTSFATPAANRAVGSIGLARSRSATLGVYGVLAYTVLSPSKVQTTNQTLEISYRITFNPTY